MSGVKRRNVYSLTNVADWFPGANIAIPTLATQCDLSEVGLRSMIEIYRSAYNGDRPSTVIYGPLDLAVAHKLQYGTETACFPLMYWVCIPCWPDDMWGVAGAKGLVLSEGA